jgi:hypothetical protein
VYFVYFVVHIFSTTNRNLLAFSAQSVEQNRRQGTFATYTTRQPGRSHIRLVPITTLPARTLPGLASTLTASTSRPAAGVPSSPAHNARTARANSMLGSIDPFSTPCTYLQVHAGVFPTARLNCPAAIS